MLVFCGGGLENLIWISGFYMGQMAKLNALKILKFIKTGREKQRVVPYISIFNKVSPRIKNEHNPLCKFNSNLCIYVS